MIRKLDQIAFGQWMISAIGEVQMAIEPYWVTIDHQVVHNGAYVGGNLADRLGIHFYGRDIHKYIAWLLNLAEVKLADRED
jgi:hypothetical protein